MSKDSREAAVFMRLLAPHQRDRMIREAGEKVVDMREHFSREQSFNRANQLEAVA